MKTFLSKIYKDFLDEQHNWCNIRNSQFSNSQYKNYTNKQYDELPIEQYYLLRYAPFYFEEYKEIYSAFLKLYKRNTLNILSIGVGIGLDFWGVSDAVMDLNKNINIDYLGLDIVDWNYRIKEMRFKQKSLEKLEVSDFYDFTIGGVNLIIFPKSIMELSIDSLEDFSEKLVRTKLKDIWIVVSYVKRYGEVKGIDKFKIIHDMLIDNGYSLSYVNLDEYQESNDKASKIDYPLDYSNGWKSDIEDYCSSKCSQFQIQKCNLVQYPMLYKKNIAYGIYRFRKYQDIIPVVDIDFEDIPF